MHNSRVKFGLKIPNRLGKMSEKIRGVWFTLLMVNITLHIWPTKWIVIIKYVNQSLECTMSASGRIWAYSEYVIGQNPKITQQTSTLHSGAATGGPRGPGPPPKPHHKIFTDYEKYETCLVNRKVKSITGSHVFVSQEAAILAQNALETVLLLRPDPLWELTALPQTP